MMESLTDLSLPKISIPENAGDGHRKAGAVAAPVAAWSNMLSAGLIGVATNAGADVATVAQINAWLAGAAIGGVARAMVALRVGGVGTGAIFRLVANAAIVVATPP